MRLLLVCFGASLAFCAQPEIRGVVTEPGSNVPVAEAQVAIEYFGAGRPGAIRIAPGKPAATVTTDQSGEFRYLPPSPGFFRVHAEKDGYSGEARDTFSLTDESPVRELRFFLSRPVKVVGRVVDEATDKPVADLEVMAGRAYNLFGHRMFRGERELTGKDGRFSIDGEPGEYVVEIGPVTRPLHRVLTRFTAADAEAADRDYENTFWPGGQDEQAALPMKAASGSTVNAGLITVRKVPYYRVHVKLDGSACAAGDRLSVFDLDPKLQMAEFTITPELAAGLRCDTDLLATGYAPGPHRLVITNGRDGAARRIAVVPFTVVDRNLEVVAALELAVALEGNYVAETGARAPEFATLPVPVLQPIGSIPSDSAGKADATGKFRIEGLASVDHRIRVTLPAPTHYVKEIRYNGSPINGRILPLSGTAMARTVSIVLDDKPAAITGVVKQGDAAVANALVILARWPMPDGVEFLPESKANGSEDGRFQFAGLAPGEYRAVALADAEQYQRRAPGRLEAALAAAPKIEVSPGGVRDVVVGITELSDGAR